jgi:hypothetical protein
MLRKTYQASCRGSGDTASVLRGVDPSAQSGGGPEPDEPNHDRTFTAIGMDYCDRRSARPHGEGSEIGRCCSILCVVRKSDGNVGLMFGQR